MKSNSKRYTVFVLLLSISVSFSGCAHLQEAEYEQFGYHGQPIVKEGKRILPLDWLGNLLGLVPKLFIFHWKIKRHRITDDTKEAIDGYLASHPELGDLQVNLNRYSPADSMRRLFTNKGVKWPYRLLGFPNVLLLEVFLVNRIFGQDHYNHLTHTIHLHSDLPAVALHELGHAKDFAGRRYRGTYGLIRMFIGITLSQEYIATREAIKYTQNEGLHDYELQNYKILYPAFGTYVGSYMGMWAPFGLVAGHVIGRRAASQREAEIEMLERLQAQVKLQLPPMPNPANVTIPEAGLTPASG